jgi:hypothetical protein
MGDDNPVGKIIMGMLCTTGRRWAHSFSHPQTPRHIWHWNLIGT